jgi:PERQ amino acid-rich with GYF domain-containing protein
MNSTNPQVASVGKRYADLAGKTAQANPAIGGAWTTVGPGGKSKAPTPTAPTGPASALRPAPGVGFPPAAPAAVPKKILSPAPPSAPKNQTTATTAQDEFMKWCRASMKGLNPGVNRK